MSRNNDSRWFLELVQDFDGKYYANMYVGGRRVEDLPEYVSYKTLQSAIREKTGIQILKRKDMIFHKVQKKSMAYLDATQIRPDCRVTWEEIRNGWKPAIGGEGMELAGLYSSKSTDAATENTQKTDDIRLLSVEAYDESREYASLIQFERNHAVCFCAIENLHPDEIVKHPELALTQVMEDREKWMAELEKKPLWSDLPPAILELITGCPFGMNFVEYDDVYWTKEKVDAAMEEVRKYGLDSVITSWEDDCYFTVYMGAMESVNWMGHPIYGVPYLEYAIRNDGREGNELVTLETEKWVAVNIQWDTDGEDIDLPAEIELPDGMVDENDISDYISDKTGFCHYGFDLKPCREVKRDLTAQIGNAKEHLERNQPAPGETKTSHNR